MGFRTHLSPVRNAKVAFHQSFCLSVRSDAIAIHLCAFGGLHVKALS